MNDHHRRDNVVGAGSQPATEPARCRALVVHQPPLTIGTIDYLNTQPIEYRLEEHMPG
ncbi:MAG: hypothetical protein HC828_22405, partial [Blastochloris sp.]|nr:hypothetical protein [Blastochloris sp.]